MNYNFTDRVRKVLAMAREEAVRLQHDYVGTEHILLGLIREGDGVAAEVLRNLAADLDEVLQRVEDNIRPGQVDDADRRAAVYDAGQESPRVRDGGGPRAEPQLRRYRAPAARPAARGEGAGREGPRATSGSASRRRGPRC